MQLTRKERQVLLHVIKGDSNATIAAELGIKVNTVKSYKMRILRKYNRLGIRSYRQLREAIDKAFEQTRRDYSAYREPIL
ncbi:MAG: hypothetical protein KatS3mg031_2296 [Chitinophagales bacterium]|nr:MAG: hypothetical protein KatS3mg031_2296 [Chitinophagales bacterium]